MARNGSSLAPNDSLSENEIRQELGMAQMAGDVNIFLHEPEEEGDAADLECEVMIAGMPRLGPKNAL